MLNETFEGFPGQIQPIKQRIAALEVEGRLAIAASDALSIIWASANAAAQLYVTATLPANAYLAAPDSRVIESICDQAVASICTPRTESEL